MGFFLISFKMHLKRIIFNPLFICTAFILAAVVLACAYFIRADENVVTVNVGILAEESDAVTVKAFELLLNNREINFVRFDAAQKNDMIDMVRTRRLECAYVFEKGFIESIKNEKFDKIITLISSPATVASGIVNELIFSAVINSSAGILSAEIASDMFGIENSQIEGAFAERIEAYHENGIFLRPVFLRENTYDDEVSDIFAVRILHGVLITLLFIFSYFLIPIFLNDKKDGLYKMLNMPQICLYYLTQFLSSFLVMFLLSLFTFILLKFMAPGALLPLGKEIWGIAVYLACVQSFSLFCVLIMKNNEPVYAGFTFVLVFQLMFGNLFLDLREISVLIGRFQVLPSAYYMNYLLSSQSLNVLMALFLIFMALDAMLVFISAN